MTQISNSRSSSAGRPPRASSKGARSRKPGSKTSKAPAPRPRRAPRQHRALDTANAVVEAAAQLLVESGYSRASTNAIAERAGVSIGSLYQYFGDKEDVFRAVVHRHREEVMPVVKVALARMAEPETDLVEVALDLMRDM